MANREELESIVILSVLRIEQNSAHLRTCFPQPKKELIG